MKVAFNKEHKLPLHVPLKVDYPTYRLEEENVGRLQPADVFMFIYFQKL